MANLLENLFLVFRFAALAFLLFDLPGVFAISANRIFYDCHKPSVFG